MLDNKKKIPFPRKKEPKALEWSSSESADNHPETDSDSRQSGIAPYLEDFLPSTYTITYACKASRTYQSVYISKNLFSHFGIIPDEFIRDPHFWVSHIHPEDISRVQAEFSNAIEKESVVQEYRFRRKDGVYRWIRDEMKVIRDVEGDPIEIVGFWTDISEQKQTEETLSKTLQRLAELEKTNSQLISVKNDELKLKMEEQDRKIKTLQDEESRIGSFIESAADGFILLDEKLNVVRINESSIRLYDLADVNPIGRNISEIIPSIFLNDALDRYYEVIETGKTIVENDLVMQSDFSEIPILLKVFKIYNGLGIITIRQEKDGKERDEKEIYGTAETTTRGSLSERSSFIDAIPDATHLIDTEGNFLLTNKFAAVLYGYSNGSDLISQIGNFFKLILPEYKAKVLLVFQEALRKSISLDSECDFLKSDNSVFPAQVSFSPVIETNGEIEAFIASVRPITVMPSECSQTDSSVNELKSVNEELEHIIYITSHDLRSPLLNIQGFSNELKYSIEDIKTAFDSPDVPESIRQRITRSVTEEIPEAIDYILSSAAKMDSLINGLLKLSRLGKSALNILELNINGLFKDVLKSLEYRIKESNVKLSVGELPSCKGDETQISQVFSNLVDNALKYLDPYREGSIRIYGWKEENQAIYCIEDNGVGIPAEQQSRIFEIFNRLNPESTKGEGLGLTISRKIIEMMSGRIWVESEYGRGSKFYVSLPSMVENFDPGRKDLVIVIAENDIGNATLIRKNLQRAGILNEIKHFSDGKETWDFLRGNDGWRSARHKNDYLLLLDTYLPRMEGLEILKQMQTDKDLRQLPVIVITTLDDPRELNQCKSLGYSNFINKPIAYENFVNAVRKQGLFLKVVASPIDRTTIDHQNGTFD